MSGLGGIFGPRACSFDTPSDHGCILAPYLLVGAFSLSGHPYFRTSNDYGSYDASHLFTMPDSPWRSTC